MQKETIQKLVELNQRFYLSYGASFHKTRQSPWTGWKSLLPYLPQTAADYADIGCGNGRWFSFLRDEHVPMRSAIGIDLDHHLLTQAKYAFNENEVYRFYHGDSIQSIDEYSPHLHEPEVITSFGLWHHTPSFSLRVENVLKLLSHLKKNGVLIISLWHFANDPSYQHKLISPAEVADHLLIPVSEFEPGDFFLGWQEDKNAVRFCHSFSEDEVLELSLATHKRTQRIEGSGNDRLNSYLLVWND